MTSNEGNWQLLAQIWDGEYWGLRMPRDKITKRQFFTLDIEPPNNHGWRVGANFYRSAALAETVVDWLVDAIEKDQKRGQGT